MVQLSRRGLLLGSAAALMARGPASANMGGERIAPAGASDGFAPDVEFDLIARRDAAQILDGKPTEVWRFAANLIKGPANTLTNLPDSYLGPLMRFRKGQKVRIRLKNELPEQTIVHWHGMHVPMAADGHPAAAIDPGQTYVYEFEVRNRAGLNFYHPHTHEATATQVYRGLAGGIIIEDEEEAALGLPSGEFEIPLVLQDRAFTADNQLFYPGDMHTGMFGFYGDHILVNGRRNFKLDVASQAYRFRILNGSNARIYKLGWDDEKTPLTIIGVDGGLLEKPETRPYVMLAPGERIDLFVDFSGRAVGSKLTMASGEFHGLLPPMAQRMMRGGEFAMGNYYPVFTVEVTRDGKGDAKGDAKVPERLSTIRRFSRDEIANPDNPLPIAITEAPMTMLVNGRPYEHDHLLDVERIPVGSVQLIEIFHESGGHGMRMGGMGGMGRGGMGMGRMGMGGGMGGMNFAMAHPIHLHGQQFEIASRIFEGGDEDAYETIRYGFVDSGLKDTVLVPPGVRVRIVKPFQDFKGRFMYHCHNLEHEDMGMMREYSIE